MFPYGNMFLIPQEHVCSKGTHLCSPTSANATPSPQRPSYPTQLCILTQLCPVEGCTKVRLPTLTVSRDTGLLASYYYFALPTTSHKLLARMPSTPIQHTKI